ncbi:MAG: glycosyltransferase family 4 protein [Planctomycetes bacterium]|nr:glycosyltransferase family 4 protein [Planctomycetota bacterium]
MSGDRPLVAACVSSHTGPEWRWLEGPLSEEGVECRFTYLRPGAGAGPGGLEACRQAIATARETGGVLVTHGVPAALRCAALQRLSRARVRHVAWSWHHPAPPARRERWVARALTGAVDAFVVHSRLEAEWQHGLLGIPPRKLEVVPWPYEEGERLVLAAPPPAPTDYACMIGASDRDLRTLFAAMERLPDVPLVIAVRPENLRGLRPPPNVHVHLRLPKPRAWALVKGCRVFVLPLGSRAARTGHSCLVQAMAFGRPVVTTDSLGLWEYVRPGETALVVPPGDPDRLAEGLRTLWTDGAWAAALGEAGRLLAESALSERQVARTSADLLRRLAGRPPRRRAPPTASRAPEGAASHG